MSNVVVKNLNVRGFESGLCVEGGRGWTVENCNFSDNFDPKWDFRGDANLVRFGMDLGWQVIHLKKTVEWKKGDEFEAARKASEARSK